MSEVWKGVALPWNDTIKGTLDPKDDEHILKSSLQFIVLTRKRERVMLPEFGCDLIDMMFEQNSPSSLQRLSSQISSAIQRWDDRFQFVEAKLRPVENTLECEIHFLNAKDPLDSNPKVTTFQITPSGKLL